MDRSGIDFRRIRWTALPAFVAHFQLWAAERQLNYIYSYERPFPYRWPGAAPFAKQGSASQDLEQVDVRPARTKARFGSDSNWLVLNARLALLRRRYDEAIRIQAGSNSQRRSGHH